MANLAATIFASVVQYHISKRMLDAQKDMHERMRFFAELNREMAAELFASQMALRSWDQRVYDEVFAISCDPICPDNIDRGRATGHFVPAKKLQETAFRHSRFNTGSRSADIRDALAAAPPVAGEVMATAANHEDLIKEACENFRWTSIATSGAFGEFNPSSSLGSVARSLMNLHDVYQAQATGAATAFGASITRAGREVGRLGTNRSAAGTETQGGFQAARPSQAVPTRSAPSPTPTQSRATVQTTPSGVSVQAAPSPRQPRTPAQER